MWFAYSICLDLMPGNAALSNLGMYRKQRSERDRKELRRPPRLLKQTNLHSHCKPNPSQSSLSFGRLHWCLLGRKRTARYVSDKLRPIITVTHYIPAVQPIPWIGGGLAGSP